MSNAHCRAGPGLVAAGAENDLLAYANACRSTSPSASATIAFDGARSRSSSPKFNIADFERNVHFPHQVHASAVTRETSYASNAGIDDLDFARSSGSNTPTLNRYSRNLNTSFLKRSASKLLPRAIVTNNLPTPPASLPGSGANSPTKSLSSFISGNSSTLSSSASKASVRAKTAGKVLFDNYFHGDSNNVLQPYERAHSRSNSFASIASPVREDGYEPDFEGMATSAYTRPPVRTRPRRSPTAESTTSTYAGKLGSWFSKQPPTKTASPTSPTKPNAHHEDDPLLNLDMQSALFPYGPVDPLNPTSFNDLLSVAEAVISTYQNAYRQRCAELSQLRDETQLHQDELEECETRARHLKAQLQDMGEQCTAQTQKAEALEGMLRDRPSSAASGPFEESGETLVESGRGKVGHAGSDSGFESDGDSVFSHADIHGNSPTKPHNLSSIAASPARPMTAASSPPQFSNDLRVENEMLRQRVIELEGAVDSCLDMISNPLAL